MRAKRRIGGRNAGSSPYLYHLSPHGYRILQSFMSGLTKRNAEQPTPHVLASVEVGVRLFEAQHKGALKIVTLELEPVCWRAYTPLYGANRLIKPDLFARFVTEEYETFAFIEVDLGTESLGRIVQKCLHYQEYYASGTEQAAHGIFPLVVWSAPGTKRAERMKKAIASNSRLTSGLFLVVTEQELLPRLLVD